MTLQEATGPTEAQSQVDRSLGEIGRRLLEGGIVPFIGAGISNACRPPKPPESGACESSDRRACEVDRAGPPDFAPKTEHLKRSLASWLWTRCKSSPDTATRVGKLLDVPNLHCSKDECEFVERCSSASLDRLSEVCTWNSDRR